MLGEMKFVDAVYCTTLANNKNNEIFVAISRGIPAMQNNRLWKMENN